MCSLFYKEFYNHNGSLFLDPKDNYDAPRKVNIILLQQTIKVGITIDAKGVGAKVKKVSGNFGAFGFRKTEHFDLKLNKVIEKLDVDESEFSTDFSIEEDSDLTVARYVYLASEYGTVNLTDFNVSLKELVIRHKNALDHRVILSSPNT